MDSVRKSVVKKRGYGERSVVCGSDSKCSAIVRVLILIVKEVRNCQ